MWPGYKNDERFVERPELKYEIMIDHIVPPACLVVDFMFNIVPFAKRHSIVTLSVGLFYLVLDFLTVKLITK